MKQGRVDRQRALSGCLPLYFYYHNSQGLKVELFFKFFLDLFFPVWNSVRIITPFHFTTDKFSANHTPLSIIFLKKKEAGQSVKAFDEVFRLWEGRTGRLCRLSALTLTYCEKISKSMPSFFKKIKIIWWAFWRGGKMDGTRAIKPLHFTTDKRNAKVNPSLKKFLKKRYGCSSRLKRMGRGVPAAVPVKACQLPSHSPIAEFFWKL